MTIAQRIELRRLGYSKDEVNAMIEEEKQQAAQPPVDNPSPADPDPVQEETPIPEPAAETTQAHAAELLTAINNLTLALQGHKLNNTEQPNVPNPETADTIFNNILKG